MGAKSTSWSDVCWVFFFFFFSFLNHQTLSEREQELGWNMGCVGFLFGFFFPPPAKDLLSMTFVNVASFSHYFAIVLLLNNNMHLQQRSEFSPKFCFMSSINQPGALISLLHCGWQVPVWRMCYNNTNL